MSVRSALLALAASSPLVALTGCESELQTRLDGARDNRFNQAKEAVLAVEVARNEALKNAIPSGEAKPEAAAEAPKEGAEAEAAKKEVKDHPLIAWRKSITGRNDAAVLKDLAARVKLPTGYRRTLTETEANARGASFSEGVYDCVVTKGDKGLFQQVCEPAKVGDKLKYEAMAKGTPAQSAAELGALFLSDVRDYWSGTIPLSRYQQALGNFDRLSAQAEAEAKANKTEGWNYVPVPFADEVKFDRFFVHAASVFQLAALPDRNIAWERMHPDYGVVFGSDRKSGEGSSDYISRLCYTVDGLNERCKGVPHEYRPALVDFFFMEKLKDQAAAYTASSESGKAVFEAVAKNIATILTAATSQPLTYTEDLKLPSILAPIGGRSGVEIELSTRGVVATTDAEVVLADKYTGSVAAPAKEALANLLIKLRDEPGNRVDYQRLIFKMAGNSSLASVVDAIRSAPRMLGEATGVREVFLLGRRRIDDSMRLSAIKIRLPRVDDSETMSFQFTEDKARTSCDMLGQIGTPPAGKREEFYLEVSPSRMRVAKFEVNRETNETKLHETVTLADMAAVQKFIEENPGRYRTFLKVNGDYEAFMGSLSELLYSCKDEEITTNDPNKKLTRTCGVSEERAGQFILALCQ